MWKTLSSLQHLGTTGHQVAARCYVAVACTREAANAYHYNRQCVIDVGDDDGATHWLYS